MGIAAFLLVFLGVWNATEFLMDRRSTGARKLVPSGIVLLLLGILVAAGLAGTALAAVALLAVLASLGYLVANRRAINIRRWVLVALVLLEGLLAFVLIRYLFIAH